MKLGIKIKAFFLFFFTLSEVRWWVARARSQLIDQEIERDHFHALVLQLGQLVGLSAAMMMLLMNVAIRSPVDNIPGVELLIPDTKAEIKVIARAPGVSYNGLLFCNDPETKVELRIDPQVVAARLIATRGTEEVNWVSDPNNPVAMHYWIDPAGNTKSEPVEVTKAGADCLRKKAGVK